MAYSECNMKPTQLVYMADLPSFNNSSIQTFAYYVSETMLSTSLLISFNELFIHKFILNQFLKISMISCHGFAFSVSSHLLCVSYPTNPPRCHFQCFFSSHVSPLSTQHRAWHEVCSQWLSLPWDGTSFRRHG